MRSMKKTALVCMLMVSFIMLFPMSVSAESLMDVLSEVDGSILTEDSYAEDEVILLTRGNYLSNGVVQIQNEGNRTVAIGGTTSCHRICDEVVCNLYLERLSGDGNWYTYKYWNCRTTDAYTYSPTKTTSVVGGYWYRACGGHSAIKGEVIESVGTQTNGIWIE